MSIAADGDLPFLHRFQQCGLGLGRRSVDFVGQHDVGEQRSLHEPELAMPGRAVFFDDLGAGDVGGHQVGRELNAAEGQVQRLGQRADHQRLGQARDAFQHHVAAAEEANQNFVDDMFLADDDLAELFQNPFPGFVQSRGVGFADRVRVRRSISGHAVSFSMCPSWSASGSIPTRAVRYHQTQMGGCSQTQRRFATPWRSIGMGT